MHSVQTFELNSQDSHVRGQSTSSTHVLSERMYLVSQEVQSEAVPSLHSSQEHRKIDSFRRNWMSSNQMGKI